MSRTPNQAPTTNDAAPSGPWLLRDAHGILAGIADTPDEVGRFVTTMLADDLTYTVEPVTADMAHLEGPDGTCTDDCVAIHPDHATTRGEDASRAPAAEMDPTDGVTVTLTRSAGADGAVVVLIDTAFEPDASDGGPGLRVLINDDPTYQGVAYREHPHTYGYYQEN